MNLVKCNLIAICVMGLLTSQMTYARDQSGRNIKISAQSSKAEQAKVVETLREEVETRRRNYHARKLVPKPSKQLQNYEIAWIKRVEAVGSRIYLSMASGDRPIGSVLVTAVVKPDGALYSAVVVRSSGSKRLDEIALKAVHDAAPFEPFPSQLQDIDKISITRNFIYQHEQHE